MHTLLIGLAISLGAPSLKDGPKPPASPVGEWTVEASVLGGKSDGILETSPIEKIVITADRWIVVRNGQASPGSEMTLDPKQDPPHLDLDPGGKGSGTKAVYKLEGDTLMVAYTINGDRPTKVESPPDSQIRMMTLKRVKK
ncbi:MAG TPA: TIGR03067 domain-containing protein [Gemmataceae bacterium]|jgi:uncharacterized protein (TIGR03067 family)|nr:TIGR03067 domain-containing protein [Gemmataceae bacterium]